MNKSHMILLIIFTACCLVRAEAFSEKDFSSWSFSQPWQLGSGNGITIQYAKKHQYRKLEKPFSLSGKSFYKLTVEYRFVGFVKNADFFGKFGKLHFKLSYIDNWGKSIIYIKTSEHGKYKIMFAARGKEAFKAQLRSVSIEKIPDGKLKKIVFSFDDEPGPEPVNFKKEHRWVKGGNTTAGTVELVDSMDHVNGGKAVKLTNSGKLKGFDRLRLECVPVPFEAGREYKVSGWFKADRSGLAQIQLTSPWKQGKKQWFNKKNFRVGKEWIRHTCSFTVPKAPANSTLQDGKLYLLFGMFIKSVNELYVKDIIWEQL